MNEATLAGRIERLERSNRRWRLVTFILGVLLLCSLATGGTLVTMLMMQLAERHAAAEMRMREERTAREHAEAARQDSEEARRRLQRELEAARNGP